MISVEAKPPGVSFESMIIHDGPSCALSKLRSGVWVSVGPHQLMKAFCSSETSWTSTNDQYIDGAGHINAMLVEIGGGTTYMSGLVMVFDSVALI